MNINNFLDQAQGMQQKIKEIQNKMNSMEFEGNSGGNLVTIHINGTGIIKKVSIDPSLLNINEKNVLEDLIVAAYNEAKDKADKIAKSNMSNSIGNITDMLGLKNLLF